jgi:hypothetical protein
MTAAEAEAIIKKALDGFFVSLVFSREGHSEPRVSYTKVSKDFLPEYHLQTDPDDFSERMSKIVSEKKHRPWTDEEIKTLITLRQAGTRWDFIAREIKRCNRAIKERYAELQVELDLPPIVTKAGRFSPLTPEQKAEIVKRRDAGESFGEIGRSMQLRDFVARDYYHRHVRALKEQRRAAA